MNKTILALGLLSIFSMSAFGQIDDVINKPKQKSAKSPSILGDVAKLIANRFKSVEVETLVDEMKRDGVNERQFYTSLGITGSLIHSKEVYPADEFKIDEDVGGFLVFTVKLTSDKKVYIHASVWETPDFFESTINSDQNFVKSVKVLTFIYDDGVSYKNLKITGFNLLDLDFRFNIIGTSSTQYFAAAVGGSLGWQREDLKNEDGSTTHFKSLNSNSPQNGQNGPLGFIYSVHAGLDIKDKFMRNGYIQVKGVMEVSQFLTGQPYQYPSNADGSPINGWDFITHTRLYAKPEISISKPIGKKTSITLGVSANIAIKDRYLSTSDYKNGYMTGYTQKDARSEGINMNQSSRQPFAAKVIIKF